MTRKRSRLEMSMEILEAINNGNNKPTRIMYKCNLSWNPLQEILGFLVDRNLVVIKKMKKFNRYETTVKGVRVLGYFRQIQETVSIEV
jgi:predicted transcriptional regulator